MNYQMFAIHDTEANLFLPPFCMRAPGQAVRAFQDDIRDPKNTTLFNHPEQFNLYQIGIYDDDTGIVTPLPKPERVITGAQLKEQR